MTLKLTVIGAVLFVAVFGLVVLVARSLYDAAWLLAILSMPASSAADRVARLLASWFAHNQKGVFLDLGMLFVFGVTQYALLGYAIGKVIGLYRST